MPVGETGVAIFKPTQPGTYTFYCAPRYERASGEGRQGTLIVEKAALSQSDTCSCWL